MGKGAYKLELPPRYSQLHPIFPVVKLKLAKPDPFPGCPWNDEPPPVLQTDRDERWELLRSLKHGSTTAASGIWWD
jgi:phytoene dehydrogenase-like protein